MKITRFLSRLRNDGFQATMNYSLNYFLTLYGFVLSPLAYLDMIARELVATAQLVVSTYRFVDYQTVSESASSRDWKHWQSPVHLTSTHVYGRRAIQAFMQQIHSKIDIGRTVLELGTGAEFFNQRLFGTGRHFYTSDYSNGTNHDYRVDAENIGFPDGAFNCVICSEVLEHVRRPQRVIEEIHRVLEEGGLLILTVPFWVELHEGYWPDYWRFTPAGLRLLLEDSFEHISILTAHQYHLRRPVQILCTARKSSLRSAPNPKTQRAAEP